MESSSHPNALIDEKLRVATLHSSTLTTRRESIILAEVLLIRQDNIRTNFASIDDT